MSKINFNDEISVPMRDKNDYLEWCKVHVPANQTFSPKILLLKNFCGLFTNFFFEIFVSKIPSIFFFS